VYEHDVGSVELVTGAHGVFDVHVDGELVFTKSMLGRYPDPNDVLPLLRPFLVRR
jgi:predicted Rdx family selenoprotein